MDVEREDRRWRAFRVALVIGTGTLALGSCSGMLLAHYTVSGMNPFQDDSPAVSEVSYEAEDDDRWLGNWAPTVDIDETRGTVEVAGLGGN